MRFLSNAVLLALGLTVTTTGLSVVQAQADRVTIAQHEAAMKQIQTSNGALGKAVKSSDLTTAATEAKMVATQFAIVERFWTQHKKEDAIKLAGSARTAANEVAAAAAAGDQMKAQTALQGIGATCKQCHSVYREGSPADGGFRLKADAGIKD